METAEDLAVSRAKEMGHDVKVDSPATMTAAHRWTCACGDAVLLYNGNIYGSATTAPCELAASLEEGTPHD